MLRSIAQKGNSESEMLLHGWLYLPLTRVFPAPSNLEIRDTFNLKQSRSKKIASAVDLDLNASSIAAIVSPLESSLQGKCKIPGDQPVEASKRKRFSCSGGPGLLISQHSPSFKCKWNARVQSGFIRQDWMILVVLLCHFLPLSSLVASVYSLYALFCQLPTLRDYFFPISSALWYSTTLFSSFAGLSVSSATFYVKQMLPDFTRQSVTRDSWRL